MTCILAVTDGAECVMAGDGLVAGNELYPCAEPKVRAVPGLAWGAAGTCRESDVAMLWDPPRYEGDGSNAHRWLVESFVPPLWKRLDVDRGDRDLEIELLVGVHGRLFSIDSAGGVFGFAASYGAIGSGAPVALGSLASTEDRAPHKRIKRARKACNLHSAGIGGRWTVVRG